MYYQHPGTHSECLSGPAWESKQIFPYSKIGMHTADTGRERPVSYNCKTYSLAPCSRSVFESPGGSSDVSLWSELKQQALLIALPFPWMTITNVHSTNEPPSTSLIRWTQPVMFPQTHSCFANLQTKPLTWVAFSQWCRCSLWLFHYKLFPFSGPDEPGAPAVLDGGRHASFCFLHNAGPRVRPGCQFSLALITLSYHLAVSLSKRQRKKHRKNSIPLSVFWLASLYHLVIPLLSYLLLLPLAPHHSPGLIAIHLSLLSPLKS